MLKGIRWTIVALFAVGCGNGTGPGPENPPPPPPPEDVVAPPVEVAPPPPPPPGEWEGDPGTMTVSVTFNGEPVATTIEVRRYEQTDIVAQAEVGPGGTEHEFSLPEGRYDVRVPFPGAIDEAAEVKEAQRVRAGRTLRVDFMFDGVSAVTLRCERNGRNTNGTIKLRRPGSEEWLPEVQCGREFFIQGGGYEAEIRTGSGRSGAIITVPNLQIVGGGRVQTPVLID